MARRAPAKKEDRQQVKCEIPGEAISLREFDGQNLDDAIASLQRVRDAHPGKRLELHIEQEAYSDYERYQVYERRPETDEEMAARQAQVAQHQEAMEARERQEYDRLQRKFGPRK